MRRFPIVLTLLALAAGASATLEQVWTKVYAVGGFPTTFTDVTFDTAGNVYLVGTVTGANKDAVIMRINADGSTAWTNRLILANDQQAGHILFDGADHVYASYSTGSFSLGVALRKLRISDGTTAGTLTYDDPDAYETISDAITRDPSGQIIWNFERLRPGFTVRQQIIAKINATTLSSSTTTSILLPPNHHMVHTRANPAGGLLLLLGTSDDPVSFESGKYYDSDLYVYNSATSAITSTSVGVSNRIAVNPVDGKVLSVGGAGPNGAINLTRAAIGMPIEACGLYGTTLDGAYIRDCVVTRDHNLIAVGAASTGTANQTDGLLVRIPTTGLDVNLERVIAGSTNNDVLSSIRTDSFYGLTAVEANDSLSNSRILELNEGTGVVVNSRTYPYLMKCHAMSPSGAVAVAGGSGSVTLVRLRDLKEITLPATTYAGGSTPTLTIRLYQPYAGSRGIALSDDSTHVTMPASVTIGPASVTGTALVTTTAVTAAEVVTIKGTYGSQTRTFTFNLTP